MYTWYTYAYTDISRSHTWMCVRGHNHMIYQIPTTIVLYWLASRSFHTFSRCNHKWTTFITQHFQMKKNLVHFVCVCAVCKTFYSINKLTYTRAARYTSTINIKIVWHSFLSFSPHLFLENVLKHLSVFRLQSADADAIEIILIRNSPVCKVSITREREIERNCFNIE